MPKDKRPPRQLPVSVQLIEQRIYVIRGHKVMLDSDLAELYEVETRSLVQAVKRNLARFPADFMFQLTKQEEESLRSQFVISKGGRGGRRYPPYAFTEQGIAMLSSVLSSERAIQVNIVIMRAFVRLRQLIASNEEIAKKLSELERDTGTKLKLHDHQIKAIFEAIKKIIKAQLPKTTASKRPIGFRTGGENKS